MDNTTAEPKAIAQLVPSLRLPASMPASSTSSRGSNDPPQEQDERYESADELNARQARDRAIRTIPPYYLEHRAEAKPAQFDHRPFLTLIGGPGEGKSISAVDVLLRVAAVKQLPPWFVNCAELMLEIRETFNDDAAESEREVIARWSGKSLLLIDDLASEKVSDYSISALYLIVNRRGEWGRTTIFTGNFKDMDECAEKIGDRIANRLVRYGRVIKLS